MSAFRFRFYVDAKLIGMETVEVVDLAELEPLAERHSLAVMERAGDRPWLVEVEMLDDPTDPERFIRFGTDPGGMREPHPLFG